jgi:hypothetical protein
MLDACIFCDCFEKGRIKSSPPYSDLVSLGEDGDLKVESNDGKINAEVSNWRENACEHENSTLIYYCIGNIALVADFRRELNYRADSYPILLEKVLYNGTHAGDFLRLEDVEKIKEELARLSDHKCVDRELIPYLETFRSKMSELVECSLAVQKPIVF